MNKKTDIITTILWLAQDINDQKVTLDYLKSQGFCLTCSTLGSDMDLNIQGFDLIVVNLIHPGWDGLAVCRELCSSRNPPLIVLCPRSDDPYLILGFELGADEMITRPVSPQLLYARIRAMLRRNNPKTSKNDSRITLGKLTVHGGRREVSMANKSIALTSVEFDLLYFLVHHAGEVVSRDDICRALYHSEYNGVDRLIDNYIYRIRRKIGDDPAMPKYLKTVRGIGYLFAGD